MNLVLKKINHQVAKLPSVTWNMFFCGLIQLLIAWNILKEIVVMDKLVGF